MPKDFLSKQVNLRENEEIIVVLHHHPITYAKQIVITVALVLLVFFLMFLLLSWGIFGVTVFLALLFTGVFYGSREFFIWYFNVFIITNQRLIDIDQTGFFSKTVSEAPHEKILDICYAVKGFSQTVLQLGTIKINAAGVKLTLDNVKNVVKVNQLLTDLIREKTGKEIEVKKVKNLTSKSKEKITDNFLNQEEFDDYDEFDLSELITEYKDTFGELPLKKFLVEELDEYEKDEESSSAEASEDMGEEEEVEGEEDEDEEEEEIKVKEKGTVSFKKKKI